MLSAAKMFQSTFDSFATVSSNVLGSAATMTNMFKSVSDASKQISSGLGQSAYDVLKTLIPNGVNLSDPTGQILKTLKELNPTPENIKANIKDAKNIVDGKPSTTTSTSEGEKQTGGAEEPKEIKTPDDCIEAGLSYVKCLEKIRPNDNNANIKIKTPEEKACDKCEEMKDKCEKIKQNPENKE